MDAYPSAGLLKSGEMVGWGETMVCIELVSVCKRFLYVVLPHTDT